MAARADFPKVLWRSRLLAARSGLPLAVRAAAAAALGTAAAALAADRGGPVCAYLPVDPEPGAPGPEPGAPGLVEHLAAAGHEVLLPVVPARPGPLEWARYTGPDDLGTGPLGLREPAGPRLGVGAVGLAGLVLVPALAADVHGRRLGRGGGYYDRTLPGAAAGTPLVAVLHDGELVDELPDEPHDHRVTGALLPGTGYRPLGNNG